LSKQDDLQQPLAKYRNFLSGLNMHKIATLLLSFFLFAAPAYAVSGFQYSKPIETDNLNGYKFVVLDKDVYAHSDQLQLQDLRIMDQNQEVPYFLDSIHDAATTKEKESFIKSEEITFVTTQDGSDTVLTIAVNHLNGFRLELSADAMLERTYALYGLSGETKWYLSEGTLANLPTDPSYPTKKEINWNSSNPFDNLKLVIHNRNDKPLDLKSLRFSYYLDRLVFKNLGNRHYRLVYGNKTISSPPHYDIMDYTTTVKKEPMTQATLGAEISTLPQSQPPENPENHQLLFIITIPALALLLLTGLKLSLRKKAKRKDKIKF